jgi:hypothetical protein
VEFVLPKGGYATTVLARAVDLDDVAARADAGGRASDRSDSSGARSTPDGATPDEEG